MQRVEYIRIYKILSALRSENVECDSTNNGKGERTMKNILEWGLKIGIMLMILGLVISVVGMLLSLISIAVDEVFL